MKKILINYKFNSKKKFYEFYLINGLSLGIASTSILMGGSAAAQQGIQATSDAKIDKDLTGLKAKTRQMIESVQADRPGSLDFVNGLNTKLSPKQIKLRKD